MNKRSFKYILFALLLTVVLCTVQSSSVSAKDLDEILNYTIQVDVKDNAALELTYHIDWKVLDSDSEGPLSWVKVGVPNKNHVEGIEGLSDTISSIGLDGNYLRIDLDREYYEGEVASFDFRIIQDYMYQVDKFNEGYTVYTFTPGWFDDIAVDELIIIWNNDKIDSFTPDAEIQDGCNVWTTSLDKGDKFTVTVTYPNDAYGFDLTRTEEEEEEKEPWYMFVLYVIFFIIIGLVIVIIPAAVIMIICYALSAGFGAIGYGISALTGKNKKITRTKIEYYDSCPGCGGIREQGKDVCAYCGKSMIKSKEVITEKQLQNEYKDALKFNKTGDYKYGNSGNVFFRVNAVTIPYTRPKISTYSRSSRGSSRSSCAHSSCACACACACAGGGRAGCTNKDFYKTGLKLEQFAKKHIRRVSDL